jgi:hypothetical protein
MASLNPLAPACDQPGMISALARRILTSVEFETGTFVSFAVAVLLNTFGVIGDPFVWAHTYLPFLMPKQAD